jgi:hypothetical protein
MKIKTVLALAAVALLCTAAVAEATQALPFQQARKQSKVAVANYCEHEAQCDTWRVGPCKRFSRSRVDCAAVVMAHSINRYCFMIVVTRVIPGSDYYGQWFRSWHCGAIEEEE